VIDLYSSHYMRLKKYLTYSKARMSKWTSYGKIYHPDVRIHRLDFRRRPPNVSTCLRLPSGRDFTRQRFLPSVTVKIRPRGRTQASTQHTPSFPPSPLPPPLTPTPCGRRLLSARTGCVRVRTDAQIYYYYFYFLFFIFYFLFFLVVVAGWKRKK
jgi:hypothetical protein